MAKSVTQEATICCGYKRCPRVTEYDDGSIDVEDEGQRVSFTPDQAETLRAMLRGVPVAQLEQQGKVRP
jgi:hypothetical protein